ncbi:hypothetical protein HZB96_02495, partial [Candidatus Gottesmanbacteria bacterium]|nr:hypothetical protein [Candidatus Gottesmanbacteria bacterium]
AGFLIILGILFRTIWHLGPNVEFVTTSALLAGSYLGLGYALGIPLTIMLVTDLIIGNTNIFLFTWSGYLVIGYLSHLSNLSHLKRGEKILGATGLGVVASIWFYIWTNFGVWLLDSWGMYPKTPPGLIDAYIMGLPFLKYNLMGNLVLVPLSFTSIELLSQKSKVKSQNYKLKFKID